MKSALGSILRHRSMRKGASFVVLVVAALPLLASAQVRAPAEREFQITKISKNLIPTPDYGPGKYRAAANVQCSIGSRRNQRSQLRRFTFVIARRRFVSQAR